MRFRWQSLFVETAEAANELIQRNIPPDTPDLFWVYLFLGTRWFSHHDSIEWVLTSGRYGDCLALCRIMIEVTDLLTYFSHYPEACSDWRAWSQRTPLWEDPQYREGTQRFRRLNIWNGIKEMGEIPEGEGQHHFLSAAVHASEWGMRWFAARSSLNPNQLNLTLAPQYDPAVTFSILLTMERTYPLPIRAFLRMCEFGRAPKSVYRGIRSRYERLVSEWQVLIEGKRWYADLMDQADDRLASGEAWDKIQADLERQFEERWGDVEEGENSSQM